MEEEKVKFTAEIGSFRKRLDAAAELESKYEELETEKLGQER
jgi:hypothetical protein